MNIRSLVTSALMAALAILAAHAAELPLSILPANSAAVIDTDAKAFRASDAGKLLGDELKKLAEGDGPFAQFKQFEVEGVDDEDLERFIIAYGFNGQESFSGYMFGEKLDQAKYDLILAAMEKQSGEPAGKSVIGERNVSTFKADAPNGNGGGSVSFCLVKTGLIAMSGSLDNLQTALDVIDGKSPSLPATSPIARLAKPSTVSMFSWLGIYADAEAQVFKDGPMSANPQAQQIKALRLVLSGEMNNVNLKLDGKFDTAENAAQMQQMIMGFKAMGMMGNDVEPIVAQFLGNLKVSSEGAWVIAETAVPAQMLVDQIRKTVEEAAQGEAGLMIE